MSPLLRVAFTSLLPLYVGAFLTSKILGNDCCEETTTTAPTTEDPCPTTNGYNAAGWETDDDGNVYVGDDDSKLFLVQMPAAEYWPFPKDWPEAPIFGSQFPDSEYYRGPNPYGDCGCGGCK